MQDNQKHGGERAEVIVRGPFGQAAQRRGDGRHVDEAGERAKAIVADFLARQALGLPRGSDRVLFDLVARGGIKRANA